MNQEVYAFIEQYIKYCQLVANGRAFYPLLTKEEARLSGSDSFVDWENGKYQYGGYERGKCEINFESSKLNESMYHAVYDATWKLASEYELAHRAKHQKLETEYRESRIVSFKIWVRYMKRINAQWGDRLESELTLIAHDDGFSLLD